MPWSIVKKIVYNENMVIWRAYITDSEVKVSEEAPKVDEDDPMAIIAKLMAGANI